MRHHFLRRGGTAATSSGSGYDLAARIAAIRAHADYGTYATDTSDPYAPSGLQLPTAPQGTLTTVNVSSLADLRTAATTGSGKHIILAPGSYSEAATYAVRVTIQDVRITLTGCTISGTYDSEGPGLNLGTTARRVEVIGGSFDCGFSLNGQDIKIKDASFVAPDSGGGNRHSGVSNGIRVAWEGCTVRLANGGPGWCGGVSAYLFDGAGYISGTTLTVVAVYEGALADNQRVFFNGDQAPGTYIVQQLTGTTGGAGTYQVSVSQTLGSNPSGTRFQTLYRTTNLIVANCDVESPTSDLNAHENPVRLMGAHMAAIIDSRLWSDNKPTVRMTSNGTFTGQSCGTVFVIGNQLEDAGIDVTIVRGQYPTVQNLIVADNAMHRTPGTGGAYLRVPRYQSFQIGSHEPGYNRVDITGNGTTATVDVTSLGEPFGHGLTTGATIAVANLTSANTSFNTASATATVISPQIFTYPSTGTGTCDDALISTQLPCTDFLYMKNNDFYTAPPGGDVGTAGTGVVPLGLGAPNPAWTTVADATTSLANGNQYLAFTSLPAWSFHTTTPA